MNTKLFALACSAAAAAALLATPLQSEEIVVSPALKLQQAVKAVSAELDSRLAYQNMGARDGFAVLRFEATADGRAENITLYRSSGSPMLDRGAIRAVSRLTRLDALTAAAPKSQVIQANIIRARNPVALERLRKDVGDFERARVAAGKADDGVLALSPVTAPQA